MSDITDPRIKSIVEAYERKRMKEKERYLIISQTEEFKAQNRARAKVHYESNKNVQKDKYISDKVFHNARSSYYYYRKANKLDYFRETFPDKIMILSERGVNIQSE